MEMSKNIKFGGGKKKERKQRFWWSNGNERKERLWRRVEMSESNKLAVGRRGAKMKILEEG